MNTINDICRCGATRAEHGNETSARSSYACVRFTPVWTKEELDKADKEAKETMQVLGWDKCDCEVLGKHCPIHKHLHQQIEQLTAERDALQAKVEETNK